VIRVYLTRACLTRYVPLSGFLNLLAVCSSNHPEALFHAPGTCGVSPPEFSPWLQHRTLVECSYHPLYVCFSSQTNCYQFACLDSKAFLVRRQVRPCKYAHRKVLIRPQVRSHPVLVLPATGGRYSLGFVAPSREGHQQTPAQRAILSCALNTPASGSVLHFRVLRIRQPGLYPKIMSIPYRLLTLFPP
jgi:hypothetical protein